MVWVETALGVYVTEQLEVSVDAGTGASSHEAGENAPSPTFEKFTGPAGLDGSPTSLTFTEGVQDVSCPAATGYGMHCTAVDVDRPETGPPDSLETSRKSPVLDACTGLEPSS